MSRLFPLSLVAIIVLFGSWVRLADLGRSEFDIDELCHELPAQSLRLGNGPRLPSGTLYTRGLDITRLVAISQKFISDPETHARLPSALFGILNLCLIAALAWSLGGAWAAVWAAGFLAIYPEAILESRRARFYTYQLNFGLLAAYAIWRVIERDAEGARRATWLWAGAAAVLILLAARVQIVTLSTAAGWGAGVAGCVAFGLFRRGWASTRTSAGFQIVALAICALVALLIARPEVISKAVRLASLVPAWVAGEIGDPRAYYWDLSSNFPLLFSLLPLIYLVILRENPRLGIYLVTWFCVPFILHSFVFAWKAERYLLLAAPGFLLSGALAVTLGCGALYRAILRVIEKSPISPARIATGAMVGAVALFAVATTPAFNEARKIPAPVKNLDWSAADRIRRATPDASLPIGSSMTLPAQFYWERLDFGVSPAHLESMHAVGKGLREQGSLDDYSGVPVVTTPEAIRAQFATARGVWIGIDPQQRTYGSLDPALVEQLKHAKEYCQGRCADLELYFWEFDPS